MARRKPARRRTTSKTRKATSKRSVKRPKALAKTRRKTAKAAKKRTVSRKARTVSAKIARKPKKIASRQRPVRRAPKPATHVAPSRLNRERRVLDDTVPTPPSSLNMDRHGSAARTGRAEMAESRSDHASMTPAITGGDVDVSVENAYFSGDETPGGDNQTPDQDVVDDIGKALGVEYKDDEELRGSDKVADRDRHRWELDPASAEDYRERKP